MLVLHKKIAVHAYKYDGTLYRTYEFPTVIKETNEYFCLNLHHTHVITTKDNKRFFHSKLDRPTIWYFFKNEWFNLIVSKKNRNYYYYINIASPYLYEEDTIKYIDFDLDYRVPDAKSSKINLLDQNEFEAHKIKYNYPQVLIDKVNEVKNDVLKRFKDNQFRTLLDYDLIYLNANKSKNGQY